MFANVNISLSENHYKKWLCFTLYEIDQTDISYHRQSVSNLLGKIVLYLRAPDHCRSSPWPTVLMTGILLSIPPTISIPEIGEMLEYIILLCNSQTPQVFMIDITQVGTTYPIMEVTDTTRIYIPPLLLPWKEWLEKRCCLQGELGL